MVSLRLEALEGDPEAFSASLEDHRKPTLDKVRKRLGVGAQSRNKGRVWGVYVTPSQRGAGLGRTLLNAVLDHVRTFSEVEQILLSVTTTQTAAGRLYRSMGFVPFGREPRALKIAGHYIDEEYMVLTPPR